MPIYKVLSKTAYFSRHRLAAQNIGIFATLMVMGAWNGLPWRYIVSGNLLINAARTRPALQARLALPVMRFAGRVLTLVLAGIGLICFQRT